MISTNIIKSIIEKLKLKEIFAIVFIAALVITFAPNEWAEKIKIDSFRNTYQTYISLCIIVIGAYYVLCFAEWVKNCLWRKRYNWKKIGICYMKKYMSPDEMCLLIETFYDSKNNRFSSSGMIDCIDGRKAVLESKRIIYLASQIGNMIDGFSYNLQPYALDFLNEKSNPPAMLGRME